MKRVFSILYIICCCTLESVDAQSAGISEVLKELQMEKYICGTEAGYDYGSI